MYRELTDHRKEILESTSRRLNRDFCYPETLTMLYEDQQREIERSKIMSEVSKEDKYYLLRALDIQKPTSYFGWFNSLVVYKDNNIYVPYMVNIDKKDKTFKTNNNGKPIGHKLNFYTLDEEYIGIYKLTKDSLEMVINNFIRDDSWMCCF
jgi:hypothetical protein